MTYIIGLLALLSCDVGLEANVDGLTVDVQQVANYGNRGLKKSFDSAVQLTAFHDEEAIGTASGGYFVYNGYEFILTAAHVVAEGDKFVAHERYGIDTVECKLLYVNKVYDIAVIMPLDDFETLKPVRFDSDYGMKRGEPLYYTGYPAEMQEITMQGSFSGNAGEYYLMQSSAWMGSSGSPVFDGQGRVVGVVSGIIIGWTPFGFPQLVNNMVVVSPMWAISDSYLKELLKDGAN
jgi:S1-C subfamily serine protease